MRLARPHPTWTATAAVCRLTLACTRARDPAASRPTSPPPPVAAAFDTTSVLDPLVRIIREQRLTTLTPACYSFERDADATPYRFTVREVHSAACGGDPQTAPRLFSIAWDAKTGDVETDAFRAADGVTDTIRRRRAP